MLCAGCLSAKLYICVVRWLIEGFCAPSGAPFPRSTEIGSRATVTLSPGHLRERLLQHDVVAMADYPRQVPTFIFDLEFIKSVVRMPPPPPVAPLPWCMFSPWRLGICLAMFVFCFANCRRDRWPPSLFFVSLNQGTVFPSDPDHQVACCIKVFIFSMA